MHSNDEVNSGRFATTETKVALWQAILFPALAAGMGWGIRGQYGHESGAMISGGSNLIDSRTAVCT
ncbi:MAG: hypothetical protein U0930_10195 [Pirellulales bacterium]